MSLQQVIKDIKSLNSRERATIAHCLIASLDTNSDEDVSQAWAGLAKDRFTELVSGKVQAVSWDEIKREVKG